MESDDPLGESKASESDVLATCPANRELGTKPVGRLFAKYAGITLIGFTFQAIMVICEGLITGNGLGAYGLAVVAVIMPLELLNLALSTALGMGTATLVGQHFGANDNAGARRMFAQGFWMSVYLTVGLSAAMFIFAPQVALFLGSTPEMHADMVMCIRIFCCFYPFCIMGQAFCTVARTDEQPRMAACIAGLAAVVATVWLYTSIFILNLGVIGSAVYYGISTGMWSLVFLYFFFSKKTVLKVRLSDMKLDPAVCKQIIAHGLPMFLVQIASFCYTVVINNFLGSLGGETELAAFSVINSYVIYIMNLVCLAGVDAVQPIASYNYGAHMFNRCRALIRVAIVGALAVLGAMAFVFVTFSQAICTAFIGDDPAVVEQAVYAMLPLVMCAPLGLMAQLMSSYFQAVNKERIAVVLGMCRHLMFTIPAIVIMGGLFGINGVWWAQPVADVCTGVLVAVIVGFELRSLSRKATFTVIAINEDPAPTDPMRPIRFPGSPKRRKRAA